MIFIFQTLLASCYHTRQRENEGSEDLKQGYQIRRFGLTI